MAFLGFAKKIFGSSNDRRIKPLWKRVEAINALESELAALRQRQCGPQRVRRTQSVEPRQRQQHERLHDHEPDGEAGHRQRFLAQQVEVDRHAHRDEEESEQQALEWIARLKPKRAILTHMTSDLDYETLRSELPGNVEPAYDGMVIEL